MLILDKDWEHMMVFKRIRWNLNYYLMIIIIIKATIKWAIEILYRVIWNNNLISMDNNIEHYRKQLIGWKDLFAI